jgi:hypothetical protein
MLSFILACTIFVFLLYFISLLIVNNINGLEKFTDTNTINDGGTKASIPCNDDSNRKYPIEMATSTFYPKTYVCCDSSINETNTAIIEDSSSSSSSDEEEMMINAIAGVCDESKCISNTLLSPYMVCIRVGVADRKHSFPIVVTMVI